MIKIGLLLSIILITFAANYFSVDNRPTSHATKQAKSNLIQKKHTVIYNPDIESNEIPMHLDRLDFGGYHRIEFFVKNGYVGLSSQKDGVIDNNMLDSGFPRLSFLYTVSDKSVEDICQGGQYDLANSCPMTELTVTTVNDFQSKVYRKQLSTEAPVHKTPPIRKARLAKLKTEKNYMQTTNDDSVYQWSAFYTEKSDTSKVHDKWLGWECDQDYLTSQNNAINSWTAKDNLWPMPLTQMKPSVCTKPLSSSKRWQLVNLPKLTNISQHPVLWECSQYNKRCRAIFDYHGILKMMEIEGKAIDNQALKPLDRKRHDMVKMVWQKLQAAAQRAEANKSFDIAKALKKELAQCQQVAQTSRNLLKLSTAHQAHIEDLWDKNRWAVTTYVPINPCGRSMHRLIQHHDSPSDGISNKQAFSAVESLVNTEELMKGDVEEPLNALYNIFTSKNYGADSLEAFQIWADEQRIFKQPEEVLKRYDGVANKFGRLTPKERINFRITLGHRLSDKNNKLRARELIWLAAEEWIDNPETLDYNDSVSLLFFAAMMTRQNDISAWENQPNIETLIMEMQKLAQTISQDIMIDQHTKRLHLSTLGMHAAWHANYLVAQGNTQWTSWLTNWFDWLEVVTKAPTDTPEWLLATKVHLEAAKRGEMTKKDCPGAYITDCLLLPPQPPK